MMMMMIRAALRCALPKGEMLHGAFLPAVEIRPLLRASLLRYAGDEDAGVTPFREIGKFQARANPTSR
jgi:hypothetical protein